MNAAAKAGTPLIRSRAEHCISRRDIDPDALKVLYRLIRRGHIAYLVGGGVRDLLLGRSPKDFDVSTDASPSQIKKQFRNCFLIGRRFRLAHIKYGEKIIETSTFRAQPKNDGDDLLQTDDNEFGTPEEDAMRRDFTINGLFYDIETFSVLDYVGGLHDLDRKLVHCIGDPNIRFQEDPVRMMRAVRFASRLGFTIEEKTLEAINTHAAEIDKASKPRVLEEIFRLYAYGSGEAAMKLLWQTGLMKMIMPEIAKVIDSFDDPLESPVWKYLSALDRGDLCVKSAGHSLMLAALILPSILCKLNKPDSAITQRGLSEHWRKIVEPLCERLKVPRRIREKLEHLIMSQYRFFSKAGKSFSKERFVQNEWFADALALYEIHLTAGGKDFFRANEWRELLEAAIEEAEENGSQYGDSSDSQSKRRRRGRRGGRRRNRNSATSENQNDDNAATEAVATNNTVETTEQKSQIQQEQTSGNDTPQPATNNNITAQTEQNGDNISESATDEHAPKKRKRRRRRKKKPVDAQNANSENNNQISENPEHNQGNQNNNNVQQNSGPAPAPQPQMAPITAIDILKQTTEEKEKQKKPRRRSRNKAIITDHRPSEAIPAFDRHSQAPHWLDEI